MHFVGALCRKWPESTRFDKVSDKGSRQSGLNRWFWDKLYVAGERSFPLTLTLSLGEREQPPPGACSAPNGLANSVAGIANRRRTILPLPWGEGRGEGNKV